MGLQFRGVITSKRVHMGTINWPYQRKDGVAKQEAKIRKFAWQSDQAAYSVRVDDLGKTTVRTCINLFTLFDSTS